MRTIGSVLMSNFDFKALREQVKQTNDLLKETFKATDANLQAIAERGPEWKQANEARYQNPNYGKRVGTSISKTLSTPEGRAMQAAKSKPHTQEAKDKIAQANIGLVKSPEIRMKLSKKKIGNNHRSKPVVTPNGVFRSKTLASEYYFSIGQSNALKWIDHCIKTRSNEFFFITVEEYIMLTGKDI